jgi:hypothetical protein
VTIGEKPSLLEQTVEIRKSMATMMALSNDQGRLIAKLSRDWVK